MAYHVYILWMNRCFLNWMVRIFYMRDRDIQLFIYENIFFIYILKQSVCVCVCVCEREKSGSVDHIVFNTYDF